MGFALLNPSYARHPSHARPLPAASVNVLACARAFFGMPPQRGPDGRQETELSPADIDRTQARRRPTDVARITAGRTARRPRQAWRAVRRLYACAPVRRTDPAAWRLPALQDRA